MAITAGTNWANPIDFGVSELVSKVLGTQVGTYNPAQDPNRGALDYSNSQKAATDLNQGQPATKLPGQIIPVYNPVYGPQQGQVQGAATTPPPTTNPRPQNTGGAGGSWSDSANYGTWNGQEFRDANQWRAASGQDPYGNKAGTGISESDLNSAYNPIFDYLNQAEQSVRGGYGGVQQDINSQYGVSQGTLDTSKQQGLSSLGTNEQKVQQTKEDAMSAARRLYNELIQGYGQRFGGSTSAGEAARVLAGNEAQRTMGGVNRDAGNNLAAIQQKKVEVEQNYNNQLMQLQSTRDQALNQANRDFQQKLLDISNTRASTASEKAQQKLSALQELRNQAYNIQLQNQQFAQQLALQKQADSSNIDSYLSQISQATGAGNTIQSGYNPQVASNLQVGTSNVGGQSALTGQIGNRKDLTNQYTGAIAPQTSEDRLFSNIFSR